MNENVDIDIKMCFNIGQFICFEVRNNNIEISGFSAGLPSVKDEYKHKLFIDIGTESNYFVQPNLEKLNQIVRSLWTIGKDEQEFCEELREIIE